MTQHCCSQSMLCVHRHPEQCAQLDVCAPLMLEGPACVSKTLVSKGEFSNSMAPQCHDKETDVPGEVWQETQGLLVSRRVAADQTSPATIIADQDSIGLPPHLAVQGCLCITSVGGYADGVRSV